MIAIARRGAAKLVALAVTASTMALIVATAGAADAASQSLAGTAYTSKTYYSTARYKAVTGGASMTGTSWTASGGCGGGGLHTGFRTTAAFSNEITQFPSNPGSVVYINIKQSPQYATTFAAAYYWMTAQYVDQPSCSASWSGTLNW